LTTTSCPSDGSCGDELSVNQLVETLLLHAAFTIETVANHADFYVCGTGPEPNLMSINQLEGILNELAEITMSSI
jgi:hypothetical protein